LERLKARAKREQADISREMADTEGIRDYH
jgi:hypothetical protein